jgi:hypothetical protein
VRLARWRGSARDRCVCCQAVSDASFSAAVLHVPDERGVLVPAGDLVYDDAPWLAAATSSAAARIVHPKISHEVGWWPCKLETAPTVDSCVLRML